MLSARRASSMVVELSPVSGMGAIWERNKRAAEVLEKLIHQRDNQVVGIGLQVGSGTAELPPSRGWSVRCGDMERG